MEWLGFIIDLAKVEFIVPEHKLVKLKSHLQEVLRSQVMLAGKLASLIGRIMSMSLALGPVTRLMTCSLYATLNSKVRSMVSKVVSDSCSAGRADILV